MRRTRGRPGGNGQPHRHSLWQSPPCSPAGASNESLRPHKSGLLRTGQRTQTACRDTPTCSVRYRVRYGAHSCGRKVRVTPCATARSRVHSTGTPTRPRCVQPMMSCSTGLLTGGSGYLDHRPRPAEDEVRIAWRVARGQQICMPHLEAGLRGVTAGALPDLAMRIHVALDGSQDLEPVQPVRLERPSVHPCVGTYDLGLEHRVAVVGEPGQVARRQ